MNSWSTDSQQEEERQLKNFAKHMRYIIKSAVLTLNRNPHILII